MVSLQVPDLIEELNEENKRLFAELKSSEKCVKLLQSYRKCLLSLSENCNCNPMVNNNVMITILENEYKTLFKTEDNANANKLKMDGAKEKSQLDIDLNEDTVTGDNYLMEDNVGCDPNEEQIIPDMPLTDNEFVQLVHPSSLLSFNNGTTFTNRPPVPKIYRIMVRKKLNGPNAIGQSTGKKLFKCEFEGCSKTYNSLKRLSNHHVVHKPMDIIDVTSQSLQQNYHSQRFGDRFERNESERKRRERSTLLFNNLFNEIPHLKARARKVPNREILNEAAAFIQTLEERNRMLVTNLKRETQRQESLQKSMKEAIRKTKGS